MVQDVEGGAQDANIVVSGGNDEGPGGVVGDVERGFAIGQGDIAAVSLHGHRNRRIPVQIDVRAIRKLDRARLAVAAIGLGLRLAGQLGPDPDRDDQGRGGSGGGEKPGAARGSGAPSGRASGKRLSVIGGDARDDGGRSRVVQLDPHPFDVVVGQTVGVVLL